MGKSPPSTSGATSAARRTAGAVVAAAALALAGCGGATVSDMLPFGKSNDLAKVDPNKFPTDYKTELLDFLRVQLSDPTNVRGAFITDPTLKQFGTESRYAVCLRYNARDLEGKYLGSKDSIVVYYGGRLNQMLDATPEQCATAAYRPFPELEKLTRLDKR
jgi:hypothetical protein